MGVVASRALGLRKTLTIFRISDVLGQYVLMNATTDITENKARADGAMVIWDERRVPTPPLPDKLTPVVLEQILTQATERLSNTILMNLDVLLRHRLQETLQSPTPPEPLAEARETTHGYISTEEAAEYLDLSPKAVRNMAARGVLPGRKVPPGSTRGRWVFKKLALDKCLAKKPNRQRPSDTEEVSIWD